MKLSKTDVTQKSEMVDAIRTAEKKVKDAINIFNEEKQQALDELNGEIAAFNKVLDEVRDFATSIETTMQSIFDDKSETWQQSDKGQEFEAFLGEWSNFSLEDLPEEEVNDIEIDLSHADDLENLPDDSE